MYDLIIRNGIVVDGTGGDAYSADLGVRGDRVAAIGDLKTEKAETEIDARGKYVTPGFIDPHTHADLNVLMIPTMEAHLMQGVTTVVGGNCGHGMAPMSDEIYRSAVSDFDVIFKAHPRYFEVTTLMIEKDKAAEALKELYDIDLDWHSFDEYIDKCNASGMDCNIAPLAGYSAIRGAVMGMDSMREATEEEQAALEEAVRECMEAGAFGISTGMDPMYVPGPFATDEETIRMLKAVKEYDGIFTSHTFNARMDGSGGRMDGYKTMLEQAKAAGVRANVSHVHVLGMGANDDDSLAAAKDTVAYFEEMGSGGLDLSYDVVPSPYSADLTIPYFAFFLKPFVLMSGGRRRLAENLAVPDFRQMVHAVIKAGMYPILDSEQPINYFAVLTVLRHKDSDAVGKTLAQLADERGLHPLDLTMDLFEQDPDMSANVYMLGFPEANAFLSSHSMAMPCSDGFCCTKNSNFQGDPEMPLYPNAMTLSFIPRYILLHGKSRFEDTIRQISGFVAERFGIQDRGVLKEGGFADIVVLDRDKLHSYDMDEDFLKYPEGFDHVIVNGVPVIEAKRHLRTAPGRMLRKKSRDAGYTSPAYV